MRTSLTTVRGKGQLTIPAEIRDAAHIEEGTLLEMSVTEEGVVELRPKVLVDAEDAWFWSEAWQRGEREASAEAARGAGISFGSDEEFLASLGQ